MVDPQTGTYFRLQNRTRKEPLNVGIYLHPLRFTDIAQGRGIPKRVTSILPMITTIQMTTVMATEQRYKWSRAFFTQSQ